MRSRQASGATCAWCGAVTHDVRAFLDHGGTSGACPTCAQRRRRRDIAVGIGVVIGCSVVGLVGMALFGPAPPWQVLLGVGCFYLALEAQVLPHELGHAVAARLLGFRVLRVQLGEGPQVAQRRVGDTVVDLRALPSGGATWSSTPSRRWYRLRRTLVVAGGPLATLAVAALAWWWPVEPGSTAAAVRAMVVASALVVLLVNLVPWRRANAMGVTHSDGWLLLATPFLQRASVEQAVEAHDLLVAVELGHRGEWDALLSCARSAADRDPDDAQAQDLLLSALGAVGRWDEVAALARRLLAAGPPDAPGASERWNSLAWADFLLGDRSLLAEADHASAWALALAPWSAAILGTRGSVLVAVGRHAEGIALLERSQVGVDIPEHVALTRSALAMGEAGRGDVWSARRHLAAAERADPTCPLLARARDAVADAALGLTG